MGGAMLLYPRMDISGLFSFSFHFVSFFLFVCQQKTWYIGHNFWMVSDRTFIFHMCIPFGKTFFVLVSRSGSSVKAEVKYQGHIKKMLRGHWRFTNTATQLFFIFRSIWTFLFFFEINKTWRQRMFLRIVGKNEPRLDRIKEAIQMVILTRVWPIQLTCTKLHAILQLTLGILEIKRSVLISHPETSVFSYTTRNSNYYLIWFPRNKETTLFDHVKVWFGGVLINTNYCVKCHTVFAGFP